MILCEISFYLPQSGGPQFWINDVRGGVETMKVIRVTICSNDTVLQQKLEMSDL